MDAEGKGSELDLFSPTLDGWRKSRDEQETNESNWHFRNSEIGFGLASLCPFDFACGESGGPMRRTRGYMCSRTITNSKLMRLFGSAVLTCASLCLSYTAFGAPPPPMLIDSTSPDFSVTPAQLTISGQSLGTTKPMVTFDGLTLPVLTYTNSKIVATLPAGITPGSYLLIVVNTSTQGVFPFVSTIGAVGATGPQGPIGPTGPVGG